MRSSLLALAPLAFPVAPPVVPPIDTWGAALAIHETAERLSAFRGHHVNERTVARLAQASPRVLLALRCLGDG